MIIKRKLENTKQVRPFHLIGYGIKNIKKSLTRPICKRAYLIVKILAPGVQVG